MATTFKRVAWVSQGNILSTELNSLGNGSYSAFGTAYDNSSGLYLYGALLINLASLNPTTGAYLQFFMSPSLDATNYDDVASSTNPGYHMLLDDVSRGLVSITTGSATKRAQVRMFALPAALIKFQVLNSCGVALAASGSTVALYTAYDQGV